MADPKSGSFIDSIPFIWAHVWKGAPLSVYWEMSENKLTFPKAAKTLDSVSPDLEYEDPDPFNPHEEIVGVSPEEARNLDGIIDDEEGFLESLISSIFGTDEEEDDTQQIVATPMPTYEEMPIDWEDPALNLFRVAEEQDYDQISGGDESFGDVDEGLFEGLLANTGDDESFGGIDEGFKEIFSNYMGNPLDPINLLGDTGEENNGLGEDTFADPGIVAVPAPTNEPPPSRTRDLWHKTLDGLLVPDESAVDEDGNSDPYYATLEEIVEIIDELMKNEGLDANVLQAWLSPSSWVSKVLAQGKDPYEFRKQIMGGPGGMDRDTFIDTFESGQQEEAGTTTPGGTTTPAGTTTPGGTKEDETKPTISYDKDVERAKAGYWETLKENIKAEFYNTIYNQEGVGQASEKELTNLYFDTENLFFLEKGADIWDSIKDVFVKDTTLTDTKQEKAGDTLLSSYRNYLKDYLDRPFSERLGPINTFKDKVHNINRIMTRFHKDPKLEHWNQKDHDDYTWMSALFYGDDVDDKARRANLVKLTATNGGMGYYSQQIHKSIDSMMTHYRNIGWDETRIFNRMLGGGADLGDPGVEDPLTSSRGGKSAD